MAYVTPSSRITCDVRPAAACEPLGASSSWVSYKGACSKPTSRCTPSRGGLSARRREAYSVVRMPAHAARTRDSSAAGTALAALLLLVSIVVWPPFLERHVSLDWRLGNVRPAAHILQGALAGGALLAAVFRRSLGDRFAVLFPSPRVFVFALLAVTGASAVTLSVLETACRLLDLPERFRVPPAANVAATFDAELGWAYQPNHSVVSTFASDERKIPSHFDGLGARVRAPGVTHDPAAPTVLFVGDSFTMGHGVTFDESF